MRRALNITLTVLISIGFILLGVFVFSGSYIRVYEAGGDFLQSIKFYFCELFGLGNTTPPTVNDYSEVIENGVKLPDNIDGFKAGAGAYFALLFNSGNFSGWLKHISGVIGNLAKFLIIILPCLVILYFVIKAIYKRGNCNYNRDTVPLRVFKFLSKVFYQPIKRLVRGYIGFIRQHSWIWVCWIILWAFNFNLVTIGVEFFAYYFYFAIFFDLRSVYTQIVKLCIDLQVVFKYFPWWSLLLLIYPLFNRFRQRIALGKLRRFEARNCGFINELPIVSITCGSMGKKKTTAITDTALSQEVMFRQKAMEILQRGDMKFPYFSWICFEKELRACMEYGTVYNLATAKDWVRKKRERFMRHGNAEWQLYGYDYCRYGMFYDDGLKISNLFDVLETYAQAYFIYVIESSLIVANYSIRTDNRLMDEGNFPIWLTDFFPRNYRRCSRHAHILDFDILRLGKKVLENNPLAGSFEFGVVAISEVGKERGNNLELKEVKKGKDEANQKNDLFNSWLKMCRHSATVDNFPFIKVFTDEQRPEKLGCRRPRFMRYRKHSSVN